jgi:transcriptional regulator with XRE-family HTH domain
MADMTPLTTEVYFMISKIPERLRELRQAHGYSQEELAEKILVTRQAISKWERGDALPDTENLIALAEIYGVSIDDLVGHTPAASGGEAQEYGGEENEATENASGETDENSTDSDGDGDAVDGKACGGIITRVLYELPYPVVVTALFLVLGFIWGLWDVAWIIFVTIPLYYSIVDCIKTRRISPFNYPVFVTCVFLFIGMQFGLWHPGWIIYVTVPIFYSIAAAMDRKK